MRKYPAFYEKYYFYNIVYNDQMFVEIANHHLDKINVSPIQVGDYLISVGECFSQIGDMNKRKSAGFTAFSFENGVVEYVGSLKHRRLDSDNDTNILLFREFYDGEYTDNVKDKQSKIFFAFFHVANTDTLIYATRYLTSRAVLKKFVRAEKPLSFKQIVMNSLVN